MNRMIAAGCLLAIGLCGCAENNLSTLEGTVFVDGNPAPPGIALSFAPLKGGSPSYASTDEAGHYEAAFTFREKGIEPGKHRVQLVPGGGGQESMPRIGPDGKPIPSESSSPPKFPRDYYQEITTITVEPGSNEIDLELTSVQE